MLNKHAQIFHIVLNLGKYIDMSVGGQFDYFLKLFHVSASLRSLPSPCFILLPLGRLCGSTTALVFEGQHQFLFDYCGFHTKKVQ